MAEHDPAPAHDLEPSVDDLIALGRDREAIDAARRASTSDRELDGLAQAEEIMVWLDTMLEQITPEHLALPTPCKRLDVAGVLDHMIQGATAFAPAFRGVPSDEPAERAGHTVVEWWGRSIAELYIAMHDPDALDRVLETPFGSLPGSVFARYVAFDGLVHAWDLSTAAGLPFAPRDEVVAAVDAFIRDFLTPAMRDGDTFADEKPAPPGATPIERLAAFSGRTVPSKETTR